MQLIHHEAPNLKMPEFVCDKPLHPKLDNNPLLKNMNKSFCCLLVGKSRSGKSSLFTALLQTKSGAKRSCKASFNKVFDKIYMFMPSTSQASMKNNLFENHPPERLFERVTPENLAHVHQQLQEDKEEGKRSLLVFDDVQSYLKIHQVEVSLLHIIANRRHLNTSLFIVAQNFNKIPKNIRITATEAFLFNVSKAELGAMFDEIFDLSEQKFLQLLEYYRKVRKEDSHAFIYIHNKIKAFVNWDEIAFEDDA